MNAEKLKNKIETLITSLESLHDSIQEENEENFDTPQWNRMNLSIEQTQMAVDDLMRVA